MITDPINVMELSAIVVLHPSQLNNDIYNNLKENLSIRILGRCYKNYGLINKIFEIKKYYGAQIFNEDIESKVQYNVIFTCEVIKPIESTIIITSILTNHKMCLTTEKLGIISFVESNNISDKYYINPYNSKITYKKTNEELKKGDMVKVKILNFMFYHNKQKIVSLAYLEDNLTEQEIQQYYENKYNEELDKQIEEPILLSRLSSAVKSLEDKDFKFNCSLTKLIRFETDKQIDKMDNKIVVLNDVSEILDSILFLTPFMNLEDVVCICIKPFISEKYKKLITEFFSNIQFDFYQCFIKSNLEKHKDKNILIISDIDIDIELLKSNNILKVNLPFDFEKVKHNNNKYIIGDIIIPPYTNKLRIYSKTLKECNYDIDKYEIAYKNYFTNFNNPDKIYKNYYELFNQYDIETTFNNIMFYKIYRAFIKTYKENENKKDSVKNISLIMKYIM